MARRCFFCCFFVHDLSATRRGAMREQFPSGGRARNRWWFSRWVKIRGSFEVAMMPANGVSSFVNHERPIFFFCQPMHFSEGGLCLLHLVVKINRAWGSRFLFFVGQGLCSVGAKAHVPWGSRRTFLEGQGARFWRVKMLAFPKKKQHFTIFRDQIRGSRRTILGEEGASFWMVKTPTFGWSRNYPDGQGANFLRVGVLVSNGWGHY